jgi:hypothetical protein
MVGHGVQAAREGFYEHRQGEERAVGPEQAEPFGVLLGGAQRAGSGRGSMRFTVAPDVRIEMLDRLLELNHQRHDDEMRRAPARRPRPKTRKATDARTPSSTGSATAEVTFDDGLFSPPDTLF